MSYFKDFFEKNLKVKDALLLAAFIFIAFFIIKLFNGNSGSVIGASAPCDTCGIGITDLVRRVKKELIQLEDSMTHNNENEMFRLKDMQMEISFVVRQTSSGKVGGSYEVVTVEGSRENSNEKVQKLILHWDAEKAKYDTAKKVVPFPLDPHFIDSINSMKK